MALEPDARNAFEIPRFVPDTRPLSGRRGPFRWVAISGERRQSQTDDLASTFSDDKTEFDGAALARFASSFRGYHRDMLAATAERAERGKTLMNCEKRRLKAPIAMGAISGSGSVASLTAKLKG